MDSTLHIRHFCDPACPFGFSAQKDIFGLHWFYGDALEWDTHMVVLHNNVAEVEAKGLTAEIVYPFALKLKGKYGMPISSTRKPRLVASRPAALAFKALQLNDPQHADSFLRELRVAYHSRNELIDEQQVIQAIAESVGVDARKLDEWTTDPATIAGLDDDHAAARNPSAAAHALSHKLAKSSEGMRYSCPSIEVWRVDDDTRHLTLPGMQSYEAYEAAISNLAPELVPRAAAEDPLEVLRWSQWPLSAAEVAIAMRIEKAAAEAKLAASGAAERDGYYVAPEQADAFLSGEDQLSGRAAAA